MKLGAPLSPSFALSVGLLVDVTSREVVRLFLEQFQFEFVPLFHGLQGRFAA